MKKQVNYIEIAKETVILTAAVVSFRINQG